MVKIISWNVNSIRKGIIDTLKDLITEYDPDILCFQETKCKDVDGEDFIRDKDIAKIYKYRYWSSSIKGQKGVALFSRVPPLKVEYNFGSGTEEITQGRVITAKFENFYIINTYVPNTGRGDIAEELRHDWHNALLDHLELMKDQVIIYCGDLNVVNNVELDTTHHKTQKNNIAGLKEFEKEHFDEIIELGFHDAYRHIHGEIVSYTWFSPIIRTVAWRLDYFLCNNVSKIVNVIHGKKLDSKISDHTWILLEHDCDLE